MQNPDFNGFRSIVHIRALYSRSSVILLEYEAVENGFRRESCFVHRPEGPVLMKRAWQRSLR